MTGRHQHACRALVATVAVLLSGGLAGGCTTGSPAPSPAPSASVTPATPGVSPGPAASPGPASPGASVSPSAEPPEPTTTNTLPAPPAPTAPAPSTAGDLDAEDLPVPAGWRTVALEGSEEEAFRGNGTWVHARDPRYAAQDVITVGCAPITRDDYPDPRAALEGNYESRAGAPGVGLLLDFPDPAAAATYWSRYTDQVRACTRPSAPVRVQVLDLGRADPESSLLDRRTYPDSQWTEVARRSGTRVSLVILSDKGHRITPSAARKIWDQLG